MMTRNIPPRDWEAISAYLDDELKPAERRRLESRFEKDRELKAALESIRQTRTMLRQFPAPRAPRNFTLGPEVTASQPLLLRLVPTLRFASVLATLLLVAVVATDALGLLGTPPSLVAILPEQERTLSQQAPEGTLEAFVEAAPDQLSEADAEPPVAAEEALEGMSAGETEETPHSMSPQEPLAPGAAIEKTGPAMDAAGEEAESDMLQEANGTALSGTPEPAELTPGPPEPITPTPVTDETPAEGATLWLRILEVLLAVVAVFSGLAALILRRRA